MKRLILLLTFASAMVNAQALPSYAEKQYHIPLSGFDRAWQLTEGSPEVKIAVIDTGVDINHREFANASFDPLSYNVNNGTVGIETVMDDGGHGTNVVGVIAADNRDGEGVSGAAPKTTIMVIKANKVPANIYSPVRVAIGIRYAADNGAHVINLSMASSQPDQAVADAISYAASKDVLVVVAAGNNKSGSPYYPAALENVIAVSSIDDQQGFSTFSNHGAHIDITAPGTRINMTRYSSHDPSLDPYSTLNGTSYAAPQVAAALGMIKALNPEMTGQQLRDRILSTARDAGEPGFDNFFGHGILDVPNALGMNDVPEASSSSSESQPESSSSEAITTSEESSSSETTPSETSSSQPDTTSSEPNTSSQTTTSETTSSEPETATSETATSQPETTSEGNTTSETTTSENTSEDNNSGEEPSKEIWTVRFLVNGRVHSEVSVEDGSNVHNPGRPVSRSRVARRLVFTGWHTLSGERFDFSSPISSDTTLVAKFRPASHPCLRSKTCGDNVTFLWM
jgi:subtilisin family serine protease